ncbi:Transferrin receptor protein 1 [Channa argus]|uniref:Transferrin receptor protein 1 n=1 Tax=Channa argus TaxID=215402 RepID=A0A6G1Q906_CHAAH|nr:Transferrin receptor protein 1 [Channa argus]
MDQARSTISKIFNGEPHSYTRFNLTQNMEGDNTQVEMKLSSDADEEVEGNGVGEHLNHTCKPRVAQKSGRTPKNLCFIGATIFLIFIIGYLIGYLVHRKKDSVPISSASVLPLENTVVHEMGAAPLMDWDDVKRLLAEKIKVKTFDSTFSEFGSAGHQAGSSGDESLANKVLRKFKEFGMTTWTDEHFIKVQDPPTSGKPNRIFFQSEDYSADGFLSYSATGTVTGAVVYAHYGREFDLTALTERNIELKGRVVLVRAGRISFAEKVANAAKKNAAAVLIYPDSNEEMTPLFGHVHMGLGDPYTPGFPSFNHTQFPPVQSSGLPTILAQTISKSTATKILGKLNGQAMLDSWGSFGRLGDINDNITVEVNNVLTEKKINNVFGVIKGFVDADRYMVIGAQRDAWGPGFAASTVGTSVLVNLARAISDMVKNDGFKPRRSIIFASWSAGEYGSIGATEWLEGYLSSLSLKAFSYVNLDGIVTGSAGFKVAASPLMHSLVRSTMKEVSNLNTGASIFSRLTDNNWESNVLEPLKLDNAAYPFLTFSGIPSISFRFSDNSDYPYFGTTLDTLDKLTQVTGNKVSQLTQIAAQFAGQIVLRLVHDHLLQMDLAKYDKVIRTHLAQINLRFKNLQNTNPQFPKNLTMKWLMSASGSYSRASRGMASVILNSNLEDVEMCRVINDRIMTVERNFLSPYVSPRESPFRHILFGSGSHTLQGLLDHLDALRSNKPEADFALFQTQFALATWTIQGCANSLAGDIWSLDNEI